jgi:endonuclease/exonuclease/phosphatase family metal-dependent hydrolase
MLNLATFNIFWYPSYVDVQNRRDEADDARIMRVLTSLDAHALVFQEILDLTRLEGLLKTVSGHDYRLRRAPGGAWLTSGNAQSASTQKVVCAYDAAVLDLVAASKLPPKQGVPKYPGPRAPFAMHLRVRETGWEFTLVGVHLKSGLPTAPPGDDAADKREEETAFLASWLGQAPNLGSDDFTRPPTEDVILLGDFNAVEDNFSAAPLHEASLAWLQPQVVAALDSPATSALQSPDDRWSTFLDHMIIDHAVVSAGVAPRVRSALIYAFDQDPALDEPPPLALPWLCRKGGYKILPQGATEPEEVPNLYRISDHRPLRIGLAPS